MNRQKVHNKFGFVWTAASGTKFGFYYNDAKNNPIKLGKFFFNYSHAATTSQTIGSEFAYSWSDKKIEAKLAVAQNFNDTTNGKIKIDQDSNVDAVIKHQFNKTLTANFFSTLSLKSIVDSNKKKKLQIGLAFDFKF